MVSRTTKQYYRAGSDNSMGNTPLSHSEAAALLSCFCDVRKNSFFERGVYIVHHCMIG